MYFHTFELFIYFCLHEWSLGVVVVLEKPVWQVWFIFKLTCLVVWRVRLRYSGRQAVWTCLCSCWDILGVSHAEWSWERHPCVGLFVWERYNLVITKHVISVQRLMLSQSYGTNHMRDVLPNASPSEKNWCQQYPFYCIFVNKLFLFL